VQLKAQSGTVLEQTTSSDGLVQLMPRKRKAGEVDENGGGCKSPGLFAPTVVIPPIVGEDDQDESSSSGTSSGPSSASVPNPGSPLVLTPETPTTPPQQQRTQLEHPGQMQEIKSPKLVTKPTRLDLPPPPDLKTLQSPLRTPSPSANRLPQIDISPGLQVLVVDDDRMTRMLFQRMLGRLKCSVTTAVNGYEALQLITGDQNVSQTPAEEEHEHSFLDHGDHMSTAEGQMETETEKEEKESRFAIVFLDNQMPVMSGVEMMRKLRKLGRNDLVVGVTGENSLLSFLPSSIADG
jgi:osomolarity two-component system sensor histidine kinase SLN1